MKNRPIKREEVKRLRKGFYPNPSPSHAQRRIAERRQKEIEGKRKRFTQYVFDYKLFTEKRKNSHDNKSIDWREFWKEIVHSLPIWGRNV